MILNDLQIRDNLQETHGDIYTEEALCFGDSATMKIKVGEATEKKFNWVMRLEEDCGCVRVQDDHVVWIPCATADANQPITIADTA